MIFLPRTIYEQIQDTIGLLPIEQGGILGSSDGKTITRYYYDQSGLSTDSSYTPDCQKINRVLENEWANDNVFMIGIIHSHDPSCPFPSCGDIAYGHNILQALKIRSFYLPIVCKQPFIIHGYKVKLDKNAKLLTVKERIEVI